MRNINRGLNLQKVTHRSNFLNSKIMRLLFLLLVVFGTSLDCPTPPEGIIQKIYEPDSKCIYIWEENLPWLVAEKECEKIKSLDFNEIIFKKGSQISLIITFGTKENSLFHKIKKF